MAPAGMNPGTRVERLDAQVEAWLLRAARRDQAAFECLYRALEVRLYNLALHMTGRRQDAEEAVQEAMHQVWIQCPRYKEGNAIGWIFRVVARESLRKLRARGRHQRQDRRAAAARPMTEESRSGELEREECLSALRRELQALGEEHRCVLAMYFGTPMSQDEIAGILDTSQGTISNRIREGVAELRQRMRLAGYASPALVSHELLSECLSGGEAPVRLAHAVMTKVSGGVSESMRLAAAWKTPAALWAVPAALILVACCIAAAVWWGGPSERAVQRSEPGKGKEPAAAMPAPSPAAVRPPPAPGLSWDFNKGPHTEGLRPVAGDWSWGTNQEVGGVMLAENCTLLLPFDAVPGTIYEIRCDFNLTGKSTEIACGWFDSNGRPVPGTLWTRPTKVQVRRKGWHTFTAYMDGQRVINLVNGTVKLAYQRDERDGANQAGLDLANVCIRSIRVRNISQDEVPRELRDFEAITKGLGVQPLRIEMH